jgi:TPR repeat protein
MSSNSSTSSVAPVNVNPDPKLYPDSLVTLVEMNEEYDLKMAGFESDCNDGKGVPVSCHHVGEYYAQVKDDFKRAAASYKLNCDNKNWAPSCFNLANLYFHGRGVSNDITAAEEYFKKACDGQHWYSCTYFAGLMFMKKPSDDSEVVNRRLK